MKTLEKNFVTFFSPGTFVAETTEKAIDSWDIKKAEKMASKITERYGATPYAFQFTTRSRTDSELDSSISQRSPMYYIKGRVDTVDSVRKRNDPKESILLLNMEENGHKRVFTSLNGYRWTQPLNDEDVVLHEVAGGAE